MVLLSMHPAVTVLDRYYRAPEHDYPRGGVLCQVVRRTHSGQIGGKIMPAHGHCDEGEDRYELFLSLVLFRLAGPPLQRGVVGPYQIRGTWFPNHLSLEGTGRIQIYGP
jgi:hypothetical protein